MFERCDRNTRLVVDAAVDESRRRGHGWLGTEHLLVAFSRHGEVLPPPVAERLPDAEAVAAALTAACGPGRRDADLLESMGIDLDEVRAAVRRTFGDEAVQRLRRPVHQPWQPWRRPSRRCTSLLAGGLSMAPRVKEAFDRARQHADRRGRHEIDPVALLLGMVEVEDAMSNRLLRRLGVEPDDLRGALAAQAG